MKIINIRTIPGPNIHSRRPVLVMKLDLESIADTTSNEIPGLTDRLLQALPGLAGHQCCNGRPGGFLESLHTGTNPADIIEHVALELSRTAGIEVVPGETVYTGSRGLYNVIVEYSSEQGMKYLLESAVDLLQAMVENTPFDLEERLAETARIVADTQLGPSTSAIVDAATRRGIPWRRIGDGNIVQLGYGANRQFFQSGIGHATSSISVELSCDREMTKKILQEASLPVPFGVVVRSQEEALAALERIGAPVVLKPVNGRQGRGVSLDLSTPEQVIEAFAIAQEYSSRTLVEELFHGKDYRVLVVDGRVVAASESIPEAGAKVFLRDGANLSTGGSARDVTDQVHPQIIGICVRAARAIGLDICGVDLILQDISQPPAKGNGVIELNASPGLGMHLHPSEGDSRDVGGAILDMLYPPGRNARIPIISVTGTNGKTTITRMIASTIDCYGKRVGMTTTGGIFIGNEKIASGDTTGPRSAQTILSDASVEVAVLETARGGMMRSGLSYDWSDIGVISNIQPDHIGQDGLKTIEDLIEVKALVAQQVRRGGTLVINADDANSLAALALPRVEAASKRVIFFSLDAGNQVVAEHCAGGGRAFVVEHGSIVELEGSERRQLVPVADIPVTLGGAARFQVANALAAYAACSAFGLSNEMIARCLSEFRDNPGRCNFYRIGQGHVMIDYGHNPDALREITAMVARLPASRVTAVLALPGDRADHVIEDAARVAARGFDRLIIKEDRDLRGRSRGEVATIAYRAIHNENPECDCVVVRDEQEAVMRAIEQMQPGELVVVFFESLEPLQQLLSQFDAVQVPGIESVELV